jgi:hypothetical protein
MQLASSISKSNRKNERFIQHLPFLQARAKHVRGKGNVAGFSPYHTRIRARESAKSACGARAKRIKRVRLLNLQLKSDIILIIHENLPVGNRKNGASEIKGRIRVDAPGRMSRGK